MSESFADAFDDVLSGNDVDALKTALQNLMVLFEQQNRNYLELKEQIRILKFQKPTFTIQRGDSTTIDVTDSKPKSDGLLSSAYQMLAAIRLARKTQEQSIDGVTETLNDVLQRQSESQARFTDLLEKRHQL